MIYSGQLTEIMEFYHIAEVQSASGYKSVTETLYLTTKAYRDKNSEGYVVDAGEMYHYSNPTFILRDIPELVETDIIKWNGERYRVISIDRYNRPKELKIKISKIND